MIYFQESLCVYVHLTPIDFRFGLNRLLGLIEPCFGAHPQCGALFLFRDRRGIRIKALYWDQNGFVLMYKRLEGSCFQFPKLRSGHLILNRLQLECLLSGMSFIQTAKKASEYTHFS